MNGLQIPPSPSHSLINLNSPGAGAYPKNPVSTSPPQTVCHTVGRGRGGGADPTEPSTHALCDPKGGKGGRGKRMTAQCADSLLFSNLCTTPASLPQGGTGGARVKGVRMLPLCMRRAAGRSLGLGHWAGWQRPPGLHLHPRGWERRLMALNGTRSRMGSWGGGGGGGVSTPFQGYRLELHFWYAHWHQERKDWEGAWGVREDRSGKEGNVSRQARPVGSSGAIPIIRASFN